MSYSVSSSLVGRGWSLSFSSWLVKLPKAKSIALWTVQTAGYTAGANKVGQYFVNTYSEPRTLWLALGGFKDRDMVPPSRRELCRPGVSPGPGMARPRT